MASECKLCALLGATTFGDNDGNEEEHSDLHARQLELIIHHAIQKTQESSNEQHPSTKNSQLPKEKWNQKQPSLITMCRELIKNLNGNPDFKCSQCNNLIRSQRLESNTIHSLINHACSHLNKDLFACRKCDLKFVTRGGVRGHLHKVHPMDCKRENYIDMTENHQNDIMDMISLCFGEAPQKQLEVTAFGYQKRNFQNQSPLMKLAQRFLSNHPHGIGVQCHLCPTSIPFNHKRALAAKRFVDHMCWHLDKPCFTCRLCPHTFSTREAMKTHLNHMHSVTRSKENYMDASIEHFEEISSMLRACFGEIKTELPPVFLSIEELRARHMPAKIRGRCANNSLFAERRLRCMELAKTFQQSGNLKCRICQDQLTVGPATKAKHVESSMQHALCHLNKLLFKCRRCSYSSTSKRTMGCHIRSVHGVTETNEFDDQTNDFHSDIMDMLSKCYQWDLAANATDDSNCASTAGVVRLPSLTCGSYNNDLKAARQLHVNELIKKHEKDGKIICRICSRPTPVTAKNRRGMTSGYVFKHAMIHLDSQFWPYGCKFCSFVSAQRDYIHKHMKRMHEEHTTESEKYEDMSDKFHVQIMEILTKCYDWKMEPVTVT